MKRFLILLALTITTSSLVYAEDSKVVIPTTQTSNYALYPASTGVFLRLDTRDGKIVAVVPSNPKKNRMLNSQPLTSEDKPGRYELFPTDSTWEWLLFDSKTGNMWLLKWRANKDVLTKISVEE